MAERDEIAADTARYVYAVVRGAADDAFAGIHGIHGGPIEIVERGDLQALVSDVPLDQFDESALRRSLEDLRWVEEVARAHDDVVRAAHRVAVVAPLSLATIFLDDSGVRDRLLGDDERLGAALDSVDGCDEYSVKVLRRAAPAQPEAAARPSSGADYLRRKREAVASRATSERSAAEFAERVHAELSPAAAATRRLAPQDPRLSGLEGDMTLNAAYLVRRSACEGFAEVVSTLQAVAEREGTDDVVVAGPWPPYSFISLDGT